MHDLRRQPLDIVTASRLKDLRTLALAAQNLRQFVPFKQLHVITARTNFSRFAKTLGADVRLMDEDTLIPGMTLARLRALNEPGFPQGAGWYFQQFLKFAFAFQNIEDDHYLIWDADTVPLRPLEFFDEKNRMIFTEATENHDAYFETYKKLFRHDPRREFSFISQHIIVRKSIAREMLQAIEKNLPGNENWAWKIMRNLGGGGTNRFSEYETLGHYVKNIHPETAVFRQLPWSRDGVRLASTRPSASDLKRLAEKYHYISFEGNHGILRRAAARLRKWLPLPKRQN
jgi:hypothetical protein